MALLHKSSHVVEQSRENHPVTCDLVNDAVGKKEILNSQVGSVLTEETPLTDLHNTPDLYPAI